MSDYKEIISQKIDFLKETILNSREPWELFSELSQSSELSWLNKIPVVEDKEVKPFIWTAYFIVKDYMRHKHFKISSSYLRDIIHKIAIQLKEDFQGETLGKSLSSKTLSSDSLSLSFNSTSSSGRPISLIDEFLHQLDKFRLAQPIYEKRDYLE